MNQSPRFAKLGFGDGISWLSRGADLMTKGGRPLIGVATLLLLISLVQWLPVFGPFLLILISPLLTAGLITVFRVVDEANPPMPMMLFAGWRDPATRMRLFLLGLWLLFGMIAAFAALALWLMPQMDTELFNQAMQDPEAIAANPEALFRLFEGVNVFGGVLIALVIFFIVLGGLYFAVPLVLFWQWPVFSSLLWSLRAMLVNWLAFLGFGLVLAAVFLAAGFVFSLVVGILGLALGSLGQLIGQAVVLIASLFIQLLMAATQWTAFSQVFDSSDSNRPPEQNPPEDPDSVEL